MEYVNLADVYKVSLNMFYYCAEQISVLLHQDFN